MKTYEVSISYSDKKIDKESLANIMYDIMMNLQKEEKEIEQENSCLIAS
ncbi:MAG: hypothetical protein ACLS9F_10570 [Clostridium paraputrificum]